METLNTSEIVNKIISQQNAELDNAFFKLLALHGFEFETRNVEEIRKALTDKGYKVVIEIERNSDHTMHTFQLVKIVDQMKVKINEPKFDLTT